jgi:hypothetical protein
MPSPTETNALLADKLRRILEKAQKKFESNTSIKVYAPKFRHTGINLEKVLVIEASSPSAAKAIYKICSHAGIPLSYRCERSFVSVTLENKKNINHVLKIMTDGFDSDETALDVDVPDNYLSPTIPFVIKDVSENVSANANTPIVDEVLPTEEDYEKRLLDLKLFMKQSPFKSGIHYAPAKMNTRLMDGAKTASVSVLEIEFRDAIVEYFGIQNLSDFVFTEESSKTIRVLLKGFSPVLKEVKDTPKKKIVPTEEKAKVPTPVVPSEPPVVLPVKNENSDNNQQLKTNDNMAKLDSLKKTVYSFLKANEIGHVSVIPNKKNPFCAANLKTAEDQKLFEKKAKQAQLAEFIELSGEKVVRVFEGFTFTAEDDGPADGPTSTKSNVKKKAGKVSKNKKTTTTSPCPATLLSLMDEWQTDKEKIRTLGLRVEELEAEVAKYMEAFKKMEKIKKQIKSLL